jgi:hypothetical protein
MDHFKEGRPGAALIGLDPLGTGSDDPVPVEAEVARRLSPCASVQSIVRIGVVQENRVRMFAPVGTRQALLTAACMRF